MDNDKATSPDGQLNERSDEVSLQVSRYVIDVCVAFGMTEAAAIRGAVRVFRPGGPFDDSNFVTRCTGCGAEKAKTLRWFMDHEYTCECGGRFDDTPIHLFNEAMINRDHGEAKRILREFFQPIEYVAV
jgi:hypothetical protein